MRNLTRSPQLRRFRDYAPAFAALVAAVGVLPASDWLSRVLAHETHAAVDTIQPPAFTRLARDQPIQPIPPLPKLDQGRVALGRALFHEPGLSATGSISCASCHKVTEGGDDNRPTSEGIHGRIGEINAPTVLNAALNFRQYWDGRAASLEDQVAGPIHADTEMGSDWSQVVAFLRGDAQYRRWFRRVFPDGVQAENVVAAIAEYERSLTTPGDPFDRWLLGDTTALSEDQKHGYDLFRNHGCISCHQGVNVGGNMYQPLGVMLTYFEGDADAEKHLGRYRVTGDDRDRHVFKVPGLRNVARTAPYFHDGSAATLEDAVRAMFVHQLGVPAEAADVHAIVAFLHSLSAEPVEERP